MKKQILPVTWALGLAVVLSACSKSDSRTDDDGSNPDQGRPKYVIAANPIGAAQGTADYLFAVDQLNSGSISTQGDGIEQDGSYRYYVSTQNKFFSLLYGQGNPGAVTTYALNAEGRLTKSSNFQTETVQVFAPVNTDLLLIKVPRSGDPNALMYRIDAQQSLISGEQNFDIEKLAGNGERAHFTWATQVGDKVFAPYMSIKGCCNDTFGTAYPDSSWVAVFSYPELNLEGVIRDNRTSYIGAYFTNGLFADENGDAYAFSPASATTGGENTSTNPSAFVRIKHGANEFDQSYFFNVQEVSGGYHINSAIYFGGGKFLLQMYGQPNAFTGSAKFAIADVYSQDFRWVTGLPDPEASGDNVITSTTTNRYSFVSDDGTKTYVGITTQDGNSHVYEFDVNSATATQGLKVEGGIITAVQKLSY
ncbi:DUF4374 domain-containing protein [Olivibacter sp. SDN3]|uniref:DUF4374 domain-containing protein n=1 Tax=Olivibacter sp. SDN3 TaxID=2764720 RepID=UPI0016515EFB|nr:DUF4374 domain-containing protein [Olivibacter sp. SDN3]QNL49620.1 DUF4374 domain-containing protein [Olivibacter sp. SDN3]